MSSRNPLPFTMYIHPSRKKPVQRYWVEFGAECVELTFETFRTLIWCLYLKFELVQETNTFSKSTIETLEKRKKLVQI